MRKQGLHLTRIKSSDSILVKWRLFFSSNFDFTYMLFSTQDIVNFILIKNRSEARDGSLCYLCCLCFLLLLSLVFFLFSFYCLLHFPLSCFSFLFVSRLIALQSLFSSFLCFSLRHWILLSPDINSLYLLSVMMSLSQIFFFFFFNQIFFPW